MFSLHISFCSLEELSFCELICRKRWRDCQNSIINFRKRLKISPETHASVKYLFFTSNRSFLLARSTTDFVRVKANVKARYPAKDLHCMKLKFWRENIIFCNRAVLVVYKANNMAEHLIKIYKAFLNCQRKS